MKLYGVMPGDEKSAIQVCFSGLLSHQPQQVVDHVLFWAWQDVIFVQTALDTKSPAHASRRHDQSQKSHHRSCVHGLKAVRRSGGIRWQRQRETSDVRYHLLSFKPQLLENRGRARPARGLSVLFVWRPG